jgi:peptide-methionine (S)-S-oxide reductase
MEGVDSAISGYMGGATKNPSYRDVCSGDTGHVEVVQVHFDPAVTSFREILEVFFAIHDPTTLNRQGNDVGTQYRSVIFTHSDEQAAAARAMVAELERDKIFDAPVVTTIEPVQTFYPAEDYHQRYLDNNPNQPYCAFVVAPKVAKFRKHFTHKLRTVS